MNYESCKHINTKHPTVLCKWEAKGGGSEGFQKGGRHWEVGKEHQVAEAKKSFQKDQTNYRFIDESLVD